MALLDVSRAIDGRRTLQDGPGDASELLQHAPKTLPDAPRALLGALRALQGAPRAFLVRSQDVARLHRCLLCFQMVGRFRTLLGTLLGRSRTLARRSLTLLGRSWTPRTLQGAH